MLNILFIQEGEWFKYKGGNEEIINTLPSEVNIKNKQTNTTCIKLSVPFINFVAFFCLSLHWRFHINNVEILRVVIHQSIANPRLLLLFLQCQNVECYSLVCFQHEAVLKKKCENKFPKYLSPSTDNRNISDYYLANASTQN